MDCEKFDQHVIDALYDELDELTMASMKRHMESCSRCATAFSGLRATREVAVLPLEEPSEELESRILFAASAAQKKTPWHRKALRALAWAGSHAMRPQLAMAAVFVLVIGSSLLLLRAKPGNPSLGPVRVTERGEPSPERDEGSEAQPPSAAAPAAAPAEMPAQATAASEVAAARGDAKGERLQSEDEGKSGKTSEAQTALADAQAIEASQGCDAALPRYDDVGVRFSGTKQAGDAMLAAAACHKKRGDVSRARELYGVLAKRDEYKDKAEEALNELAPVGNMSNKQMAAATAAATAAPTATSGAAGKAVAAPAPPAATAPGGGGGKGVAAPAPKPAPVRSESALASDQGSNSKAPGGAGTRSNAAAEKRKVMDVNLAR